MPDFTSNRTNLFDQPPVLRKRQAANLGFDPSAMIQSQIPGIQQDVEERRQMGRRKYAEDILQQGTTTASQELANRMTGYKFSREQAYNQGFQNPQNQALIKAYMERQGMPYSGPITSPEQFHDFGTMQSGLEKSEAENKQIAGVLITYTKPGTPEYEWAARTLGIHATAPTAAVGGTSPAVGAPGGPVP